MNIEHACCLEILGLSMLICVFVLGLPSGVARVLNFDGPPSNKAVKKFICIFAAKTGSGGRTVARMTVDKNEGVQQGAGGWAPTAGGVWEENIFFNFQVKMQGLCIFIGERCEVPSVPWRGLG